MSQKRYKCDIRKVIDLGHFGFLGNLSYQNIYTTKRKSSHDYNATLQKTLHNFT